MQRSSPCSDWRRYTRRRAHLSCDNDGEFVAKELQHWMERARIKTRFIEPGSPWKNSINESFSGKFRDECLNCKLLANCLEAQCVGRAYAREYNTEQPHGSVDYLTPQEYRSELLHQAHGSGKARQAGPSLRHELPMTTNSNPT